MLSIPLLGSSRERIGKELITRTLYLGEVLDFRVDDRSAIGSYDINRLTYDSEVRRVTIETGFACTLYMVVATLDLTFIAENVSRIEELLR